MHAISGNVDTAAVRALLPARLQLELGGVRIGMVHIPGPAAGRLERLRAAFPRCDAVVFGHTHMPEHERARRLSDLQPRLPDRAPARARPHDGPGDDRRRGMEFELLVVG